MPLDRAAAPTLSGSLTMALSPGVRCSVFSAVLASQRLSPAHGQPSDTVPWTVLGSRKAGTQLPSRSTQGNPAGVGQAISSGESVAEAGCVVSFQHHLLCSGRFLGGRGRPGGLWKVIPALCALG